MGVATLERRSKGVATMERGSKDVAVGERGTKSLVTGRRKSKGIPIGGRVQKVLLQGERGSKGLKGCSCEGRKLADNCYINVATNLSSITCTYTRLNSKSFTLYKFTDHSDSLAKFS